MNGMRDNDKSKSYINGAVNGDNSASEDISHSALAFDRRGSGEPMVLIHGLGSERGVWLSVIPLLEKEFDVISIDLPGFGESQMPASGVADLKSQVDAVADLLRQLGIDRPHFVGNSMGGRLALEFGRRGLAKDIVAISPHGAFSASEGEQEQKTVKTQRVFSRLMAPFGTLPFRTRRGKRFFLAATFGNPEGVPAKAAARSVRSFVGCEGFDTAFDSIFANNIEGLEEIKCPVLILWGDRDVLLNPEQGKRIVAQIKGAKLHNLPGMGHVPMWDDPSMVAGKISTFCGGD